MQTVGRFWAPSEAYLFAGRLRAEGIVAFTAGDQHVSNNWMAAIALGGVRVQVPNDEIEHARDVFADCQEGRYEDMLERMFGDIANRHCPACGSGRYEAELVPWHVALGLLLMPFLGASRLGADRWRCKDCGTHYR